MSWHPLDAPDNYSDREREGESGEVVTWTRPRCMAWHPTDGYRCALHPGHAGVHCLEAGVRKWNDAGEVLT